MSTAVATWPPDIGIAPYYSDERVVIFHSDCRDVLPLLSGIESVVTSPPYNLGGYQRKTVNGDRWNDSVQYESWSDNLSEQDYQEWQLDVLRLLHGACTPMAHLFYNHKVRQRDNAVVHPMEWLTRSQWTVRQELVWHRNGSPNQCPVMFTPVDERIYWMTRERLAGLQLRINLPSVWRIDADRNNSHPAPFPVEVPARCLTAIDAATVLDPFAGSCTTAVAAKQLGRRCICIELEERYCEIGAQRCRQGVLW